MLTLLQLLRSIPSWSLSASSWSSAFLLLAYAGVIVSFTVLVARGMIKVSIQKIDGSSDH